MTTETAIFEGETRWFKAIGEPRPKYQSELREWSFELSITKAGKELLKSKRVKNHIKYDEDYGQYITLRLDEFDKTKKTLNHIPVKDVEGNDWPQDKWIGNLSKIRVKVAFYPFTDKEGNKCHKISPVEITILEHIPYQSKAKATEKRVDNEDWTAED